MPISRLSNLPGHSTNYIVTHIAVPELVSGYTSGGTLATQFRSGPMSLWAPLVSESGISYGSEAFRLRTVSADFNWVRDDLLVAFLSDLEGDRPPIVGEIVLAVDEDGTSRLVQVRNANDELVEFAFLPSPKSVTVTTTTTVTFTCPSQKYDFKVAPSAGAKDSSIRLREVVGA